MSDIPMPKPGHHILLVDGKFKMIGDVERHLLPSLHEQYKQNPQQQYVIAQIMVVAETGPVNLRTHASERMV